MTKKTKTQKDQDITASIRTRTLPNHGFLVKIKLPVLHIGSRKQATLTFLNPPPYHHKKYYSPACLTVTVFVPSLPGSWTNPCPFRAYQVARIDIVPFPPKNNLNKTCNQATRIEIVSSQEQKTSSKLKCNQAARITPFPSP